MGNLLEIGVAMYTDGTYYDLLLSERLHLGLHSAKNILRLSRAFAATRDAISDLQAFYTKLDVHPYKRGESSSMLVRHRLRPSVFSVMKPTMRYAPDFVTKLTGLVDASCPACSIYIV